MPLTSGRETGSQSQSAPHQSLLSNTRPSAPPELSRNVPRPACGSVGPCHWIISEMADASGMSGGGCRWGLLRGGCSIRGRGDGPWPRGLLALVLDLGFWGPTTFDENGEQSYWLPFLPRRWPGAAAVRPCQGIKPPCPPPPPPPPPLFPRTCRLVALTDRRGRRPTACSLPPPTPLRPRPPPLLTGPPTVGSSQRVRQALPRNPCPLHPRPPPCPVPLPA